MMPDGLPADDTHLSPAALRDAFGRFATGVCVITAAGPDGPVGFTANSFSSLSLAPPLVLWCPARSSRRYPIFAAAHHYAIHVLAESQADWVHRFSRTGEGFAGLALDETPEGLPVFPEALARFDCAAHAAHDGGDHAILVGRVLRVTARDGAPLVFSQGRYGQFLG